MNKKKTALLIAAVFIVLLIGAYALYSALGESYAPEVLTPGESAAQSGENAQIHNSQSQENNGESEKAPDFTVYNLNGEPVKLSDYEGKSVVLNFWASWCGPCKSEMPDFQEKYKLLGKDVQFLMVNMTDGARETVSSASEFISSQGYTFPVLYDTDSSAAYAYGVYALPTTYFIDSEGRAAAKVSGAIDSQTLQKGIDMISGK